MIKTKVYFSFLFLLLLFIYFPSFFHPPRSDCWTALCFFYRIDVLGGAHKWRALLTFDPLLNITFRPLSFLIPYFEHLIFGANSIYAHLINFSIYCLSIVLLYKFALKFCKSKMLAAAFLGLFACLFSHFDLVCWAFHSHIILGFCFFLWGFILYINYLQLGKTILLVFVSILFLLGMLLYESLLLWPLSIIILCYINWNDERDKVKKIKRPASYLSVIGPVYLIYGLLFLLNRLTRNYLGPGISLAPLFLPDAIILNIFAVFLNVLYNNFLLNLVPFIAFPLDIDVNLCLGGFIGGHNFMTEKIIFLGGGLASLIFTTLIIYLFRKRHFQIIKVLAFFAFLLFSEHFILFHCKFLTNPALYNLTQFRFQYIPNALFILMILILLDRFLKLSQKGKITTCFGLFLISLLNIQATRQGVAILTAQLAPLKQIISNIRVSFKNGQINEENRIFLDDDIAKGLPALCWNKMMSERCMRGTFQWLFSKEEIKCFSSFDEAEWIINESDYSIINKPR